MPVDPAAEPPSQEPQEAAVVRVVRPTPGRPTAGMGVLVGNREVVTCAHVVNTALGRDQREQEPPGADDEVLLEFPLLPGRPVRSGRVSAWVPPLLRGEGSGDVAGLTLTEDAPAGAPPARFDPEAPPPGSAMRAYGYPEVPPRAENGAWVRLVVSGQVPGGLLQVESRSDQTVKAQPGYSGSPVWRDDTGRAGGLLQATPDAGQPERDAYVLTPGILASAWEAQFDYLAVAPNPYRGLSPFTTQDRAMFFGRERDVQLLHDRLAQQPLVVVLGASGVGKSSLVHAGLVPRLDETGEWAVVSVRPGQDPWRRLGAALLDAERGPTGGRAGGHSRREVDEAVDELQAEGLAPFGRDLRSRDLSLLVVVDQLEELLAEVTALDHRLLDLLIPGDSSADAPFRLVLALRDDYLPGLLRVPGIGRRLDGRMYMLSPLAAADLRSAVERPALARGVLFEDGLVDEIVEEAGAGSLPLLQFTLGELWGTQRHRMLTFAGYRSSGGVAGGLDRFADSQVAPLPEATAAMVDAVLIKLVRTPAGDPGLATRQRTYRGDLADHEWTALARLAAARLVTVGSDERGEYGELAHEALIRSWKRLAALVRDNADFLGWLASVRERADEGDPLGARRIAEAQRWLETRPEDVPPSVEDYVATSVAAAERQRLAGLEAERARDLSDSLRLASEAQESIATEAETALLVAWEAVSIDRNELSEAAFRRALDALSAPVRVLRRPAPTPATSGFLSQPDLVYVNAQEIGLVETFSLRGELEQRLQLHGSGPAAVAPAGGGRLLAYRTPCLRLVAADGALLAELEVTRREPSVAEEVDLAVRDDGSGILRVANEAWMIEVGNDPPALAAVGHVTFFDPDDPGTETALRVFKATLDPRRPRILVEADHAMLWGADGDCQAVLEPPDDELVYSAAFLAAGTVVTGGLRGGGYLWSSDGDYLRRFRPAGSDHDLEILAVDREGVHFATAADRSGAVEVWAPDGKREARLEDHGAPARCGAFSPDLRLLAWGTGHFRIHVWDWREQEPVAVLHGHQSLVSGLQFHPSRSDLLLSTSRDGEVRLWRLGQAGLPALQGHTRTAWSVAATPAGPLTSSEQETVLWRGEQAAAVLPGSLLDWRALRGSRRFAFLLGSAEGVGYWTQPAGGGPPVPAGMVAPPTDDAWRRGVLSPDGRRVALIAGRRADLWDDELGWVGTLVDHTGRRRPARRVVGASFLRRGKVVVTANENGTVSWWSPEASLLSNVVADYGADDAVLQFAADPRGELVAIGLRRRVRIWDGEGREAAELAVLGYKVQALDFSPDGAALVTVADNPDGGGPSNHVELWARDGTRLALLDMDTRWIAGFDPGGRYLMLRDATTVGVFDLSGGRIGTLGAPLGVTLLSVATSPDGAQIAAVFSDGAARVWDAGSRRRTMTIHLGAGSLGAFFSDGGRRLLVPTEPGPIRQVAMDVEELFPIAAERVGRGLSETDLERFAVPLPPRVDPSRFAAG